MPLRNPLNQKTMLSLLERTILFCIVAIPFFLAIAPAPTNIFMGALIAAFIAKKIIKKEKPYLQDGVTLPLFLYFLTVCLSLFNSVDYYDTIKGGVLRLLQYMLVFCAVAQEVKGLRQARRVVFAMAIGIALASMDAVWQVVHGRDFIRQYAPVVNLGLVRATASFKDANLLGIYLSGFFPLVAGLAIYHKKSSIRAVYILCSLLGLTGIFLTYSRPTYLALYAAILFMAVIMRHKTLLALLVAAAVALPILAPRPVRDWAKQMEYNPLRMMCNDDRIAAYRHSLNMIKAHPFLGVGANTFMKNYKRYKEFPEYRNVVTIDHMYAHNNFLHMAAEVGLVGFSFFAWFLFLLFKKGASRYRKTVDPYQKLLLAASIACLIAFLVNGLTESSLFYSRVAVIFWYCAGFMLAIGRMGEVEDAAI